MFKNANILNFKDKVYDEYLLAFGYISHKFSRNIVDDCHKIYMS